jgi:hypothetical protein
MIICGQEFTLYLDYDRGKFNHLDLPGKVFYMRERVDRDLIRPCQLAIRCQGRVSVALLVPGLICGGISAAATFLNGARTKPGQDQVVFVDFVRRYMHPDLQVPLVSPTDQRVKDYADWLYLYVRCGLAHGFALEWGHIENSRVLPYLGLSATGQPQINQDELVMDFARGWNRYLDATTIDPVGPLARKFTTRFDAVFND